MKIDELKCGLLKMTDIEGMMAENIAISQSGEVVITWENRKE
jgi:hypothetical protein